MKKNIPLRSLVICLENDCDLIKTFDLHERISFQHVKNDLVGAQDKPELDSIVRNETFRRIALKLSLGERVVFHGANLSHEQRDSLTKLALSQGSPVFYLISEDKISHFHDGSGEIVIAQNDVEPVRNVDLNYIHEKFDGITVVGDVHGDINALNAAIAWAKSRNNYLLFLGDLIDYGPYPLQVLDKVYEVVMDGLGTTLIGNHERKIARWIHFREENSKMRIRISDGNKVTIDALSRMSLEDRTIWIGKFKSVIAKSSLILSIQNFTFAHAAIHPDYWKETDNIDIENFALYGEPDPASYPDFKLAHSWLNYVPAGKIVLVGHESHSVLFPLVYPCNSGGKVVFLDTGCGKGGPLSTADILFGREKNLILGNFNRHVGHAGSIR